MKLHDLKYFLLVFGALCTGKPQNNVISSEGECKVTEKATGDIKPCQFPFIYNNKTYYGCTTVDNGENGDDGIAWLVWFKSLYRNLFLRYFDYLYLFSAKT